MERKYSLIAFMVLAVSQLFVSTVVSAASLIPVGSLTSIGADLNDTFTEGMTWAYPIMLTFTGGVIAFTLVRRLIKMGAKA